MSHEDYCVICGGYVPEGRQVCRSCEKHVLENDLLYYDVKNVIMDYESSTGKDKNAVRWNDIFYHLLVRVKNTLDRL